MEMVAGGSPDWSALHQDLLTSIRRRLPAADFVRFAAICKPWGRTHVSTPAPELPWVIIPPLSVPCLTPDGSCSCPPDGRDTYNFFCPSDGKTFTVVFPRDLLHTAFVGCHHGWVALVHYHTAQMFLVNPLTRVLITTPSLATVPNFLEELQKFTVAWQPGPINWFYRDFFLDRDKVVMSSEPTTALCKITLNWYPPLTATLGGEIWTSPPDRGVYNFQDVVYHEGEAAFYGIQIFKGILYRWEVDGEGAVYQFTQLYDPHKLDHRSVHLAVHQHSGDLMMVHVNYERIRQCNVGYQFTVMKLFRYVHDSANNPWHPLQSLDGCSLFVGQHSKNQSICLSAEDVPGLRPNCIFLTDKVDDSNMTKLWVYDLNGGVLENWACYNIHDLPHETLMQHGHWFIPKLAC